MTFEEKKELGMLACKVRMGVVTATHAAKSGHPGGSLSAADLFTYLYFKELNVDPARLQSLLDYVPKYGIDPAPERVFSLPQVPEAHAYLESTHSFGKVIVVI